jgi:hypothetical protein
MSQQEEVKENVKFLDDIGHEITVAKGNANLTNAD